MSKTRADYEKEFLDTVEQTTGNTLDTWMELIDKSDTTKKTKALTSWIKQEHGLNHMQATFLANIYLNDGKPVYADSISMVDALFEGREDHRSVYEILEKKILKKIKGAAANPTKTYMEFADKRCFATARIMKKNIRVGLDLPEEVSFDTYVKKAKGLGAMPRFTHMIEIQLPNDVNDDLLDYIKRSYDNVHQD